MPTRILCGCGNAFGVSESVLNIQLPHIYWEEIRKGERGCWHVKILLMKEGNLNGNKMRKKKAGQHRKGYCWPLEGNRKGYRLSLSMPFAERFKQTCAGASSFIASPFSSERLASHSQSAQSGSKKVTSLGGEWSFNCRLLCFQHKWHNTHCTRLGMSGAREIDRASGSGFTQVQQAYPYEQETKTVDETC